MDKYDKQIQELTEHPELIYDDWGRSIGLFAYAMKSESLPKNQMCGCLTQIKKKHFDYVVEDRPDLTEQIRVDPRIPGDENFITVKHLPVFAEWQRILDKELSRGEP